MAQSMCLYDVFVHLQGAFSVQPSTCVSLLLVLLWLLGCCFAAFFLVSAKAI